MKIAFVFLESVVLLAFFGCGSPQTPPTNATHYTAHDDHAHAAKGPHGGSLIELGNEKYHAELVHDDATSTVIVYVLDAAAKKLIAIEATELKVNLSHDGQAEQFTLVASPQASDTAGKTSRFISENAEICEELCHEHAAGQLVVNVGGKQYRGDIQHDRAGHDHGAAHSHSGDDALVWSKPEIQHSGYVILLGHHGEHLYAGKPVEPAVSLTRDGHPVAEAQVFNSLWSGDGKTMLANEIPTIYEPPTTEEPAHYAQGGLAIPNNAKDSVIRFRIVLPGNTGEVSYDLAVTVE